ncbi:MAG: hypothetical protein ACYSUP_05980 [Planctomycetota bacterium]
MATCTKCGRVSEEIAEVLSICVDCLREADDDFFAVLKKVHARSREEFGLPASAPSDPGGIQCSLCRNECRMPLGGRGYCGVRRNEGGRLAGGTAQGAAVSWYCDPLPTNCVADWVCAGGSGAGYPQWAYQRGAEHGYVNLACSTRPAPSIVCSVRTGITGSVQQKVRCGRHSSSQKA